MYHIQVKNSPSNTQERTRTEEFQFQTAEQVSEFLAMASGHGWHPVRFIAKECVSPATALRICLNGER